MSEQPPDPPSNQSQGQDEITSPLGQPSVDPLSQPVSGLSPQAPKRRVPRNVLLGVGVAAIVIVALVVGILVGRQSGPSSGQSTPRAAPASVADQTDANGQQCPTLDSLGYCPGDDPSPPSPMDNWCNGNGYSDFQNVESDMNQLSSDLGNNDLISAESDGASLFHDASVAGLNRPPGKNSQKLHYLLYMGWLLVAGEKLSKGDVSGASDAITKARSYKNDVANLTNECA